MSHLPAHLTAELEWLQRAFPDGVSDEDCMALLVALDERYSEESLGLLVGELTGLESVVVINDHAAACLRRPPDPTRIQAVSRRLGKAGPPETD